MSMVFCLFSSLSFSKQSYSCMGIMFHDLAENWDGDQKSLPI